MTNTSVEAVVVFTGPGAFRITRLEVFDQSSGTGGFIKFINGGVNHRQVEVHFQSFEFGHDIDSYDFFLGEPTDTSLIVHT